MRSSRSILSTLALGVFAVFLVLSLSRSAWETARNGFLVYTLRGETPFQERARCYGPVYAQAIETIRRTIPRDGAYVLINGDPSEQGGPLWVKFDLAPRRAVFVGDLNSLGRVERLKKRLPRAARWVVIAYGPYRKPMLIERYKFVQGLERLRERKNA